MRDGRLCIYELMAEESAVNYWEVIIQFFCSGTFLNDSFHFSF